MQKVVGVDACKDGWIAAVVGDGQLIDVQFHDTARAVIDAHPDAKFFAFDIPIGLSEHGKRDADNAARSFLGGRAGVVFNSPARDLLSITHQDGDYRAKYRLANAESKRITNMGISSQTFALFPKIAELDLLKEDDRIYEAHPEVSFAALSGGLSLPTKSSWNGLMHRIGLLRKANLLIPDQLDETCNRGEPDDIVDAVACAWTAERIANGTARTFPDPPQLIDGRKVAIWC